MHRMRRDRAAAEMVMGSMARLDREEGSRSKTDARADGVER